MENQKYNTGDVVYYLGRTKCTVLSNTLKGGGVNLDEAVMYLRSAQGTCIAVPVKHQDLFLSEKPIGLFDKWPLKRPQTTDKQ